MPRNHECCHWRPRHALYRTHRQFWIFHFVFQFSSCYQAVSIHHLFSLHPFVHTFAPRKRHLRCGIYIWMPQRRCASSIAVDRPKRNTSRCKLVDTRSIQIRKTRHEQVRQEREVCRLYDEADAEIEYGAAYEYYGLRIFGTAPEAISARRCETNGRFDGREEDGCELRRSHGHTRPKTVPVVQLILMWKAEFGRCDPKSGRHSWNRLLHSENFIRCRSARGEWWHVTQTGTATDSWDFVILSGHIAVSRPLLWSQSLAIASSCRGVVFRRSAITPWIFTVDN